MRCSRTLLDAGGHALGDLRRVADDDLVARGRRFAQGESQELVDLLEVRRRGDRAGEDQRERQVRVLLAQQDAEQVEDFLRRADATGEHDDAVADADERFEALLDVRHDHEVVDDRVRRLGGDDAGLGDADVTGACGGAAWHGRSLRLSSAPSSRPGRSRCRCRGRAGRARSRPAWCRRIRRG